MDDRELEMARMIATNSGDIPDAMDRLIDEVESLTAELGSARAEPGADYHNLAMRTAAGPEVFFRAKIADMRLSGAHFFNGSATFADALADFIHAARVLSAMKATLFYGKDWEAPHRADVDALFNQFHHDQFENYQTLHAILGIGSEAGELLEDVVQLVSLPDPSDCDEADLPKLEGEKDQIVGNMRRELGDIDWFQELFVAAFANSKRRFSIDDCRAGNIGRLRVRFPDKFTTTAAIARADEGFDFEHTGYAEVIEAPVHPGAELGIPAPIEDAEFTEVAETPLERAMREAPAAFDPDNPDNRPI